MANNIEDLKTTLGIGAKKYRFKLILPLAGAEKADLLVKTAKLPNLEIAETEVFTKGRKLKIRGHRKFDGELTCTFLSDDAHTLRKAFETIMEKTDSYTDNKAANSHTDYMISGMSLVQLAGDDTEKAKWEFKNVWVKSVGEIEFTSEEGEDIIELQVTFCYSDYVRTL
jgi:hypothetical protein